MATTNREYRLTVSCGYGRHGTGTRTYPAEFAWEEQPCSGYARSMDGYVYECPCYCHGHYDETFAKPWLPSLLAGR